MLEVCARMFEPSEDTPLGSVFISIGAETVQGSAGIVCRDLHTLLLSIVICLIHRWKWLYGTNWTRYWLFFILLQYSSSELLQGWNTRRQSLRTWRAVFSSICCAWSFTWQRYTRSIQKYDCNQRISFRGMLQQFCLLWWEAGTFKCWGVLCQKHRNALQWWNNVPPVHRYIFHSNMYMYGQLSGVKIFVGLAIYLVS